MARFMIGIVPFCTASVVMALAQPTTADPAVCPDRDRMLRTERGLGIEQLMREHAVPGISLAVIHDHHISCAIGYGVTEKGGTVPVTPATPFLGSTHSKAVHALGW